MNKYVVLLVILIIIFWVLHKSFMDKNYTIKEVYRRLKKYYNEFQARLITLHILLETGIRTLDLPIKQNYKYDYVSDLTLENIKNNNLLNFKAVGNPSIYQKYNSLEDFIVYTTKVWIGATNKKQYARMISDAEISFIQSGDIKTALWNFAQDLVDYQFTTTNKKTEIYFGLLSLYNAFWHKL